MLIQSQLTNHWTTFLIFSSQHIGGILKCRKIRTRLVFLKVNIYMEAKSKYMCKLSICDKGQHLIFLII